MASPPLFVAEVSSNHQGSLDRCLEFVDCAAKIGCDAVKFQLFSLDRLFTQEAIKNRNLAYRRAWELDPDWLKPIRQHCQTKGVLFGCTPFDTEAVDYLDAIGVDFIKLASYNVLDFPLLRYAAVTHRPIVLSTGMATLAEVRNAVVVLRTNTTVASGCSDLTLLHCVSDYPTKVTDANLAALETLKFDKSYCYKTGWSDHTVSPAVIYRAVHHYNASMIEFHLDLDGTGDEYKMGHCWLPEQIASVIATVKQGFMADGNGQKQPRPCELEERMWRADPSDGLRPLMSIRGEL